jgi:hypothetical protein
MELIVEPEVYAPSIDEIGNYIDKIPPFNTIKYGIRCPCGSRKDKTFDTSGTFSAHIKTKTHQKWLNNLNLNKANETLKSTVQNQRLVIAKLDKDLQNKIMTIDYLTQQLSINNKVVNNLLSFD